jgi:hypothetical protein
LLTAARILPNRSYSEKPRLTALSKRGYNIANMFPVLTAEL